MLLAKGDNVPTHVSGAVFLDPRAHFDAVHAFCDGTIGGRLAAETLPMIQPTIALAATIGFAVDIFYLHLDLFFPAAGL
jgi:hypothetical protein